MRRRRRKDKEEEEEDKEAVLSDDGLYIFLCSSPHLARFVLWYAIVRLHCLCSPLRVASSQHARPPAHPRTSVCHVCVPLHWLLSCVWEVDTLTCVYLAALLVLAAVRRTEPARPPTRPPAHMPTGVCHVCVCVCVCVLYECLPLHWLLSCVWEADALTYMCLFGCIACAL